MNYVSNEKIKEIIDNIDIVEVVSKYIPLTKRGKNYFGVCPFHPDSDPSLSVSKEKGIYTCFSCHATGNAINFIKEYENITFIEALKIASNIASIELDIKDYKKKTYNTGLYDVFELAQKFYQNNINTSKASLAKEYLHNRGLNDEIIKTFKIGLALKSNNSLAQLLVNKNFKEKDIIDSGLVSRNSNGLVDFNYNRIMFPITNLNGQIVGYSARIYDNTDGPKYINTKETEIFKKGEILYNYQNAKEYARVSNTIIVMEGFMDVIRAYSIGIKNVIALMGTAMTKKQAMEIKKLASNVILCFDGDKAGLKASFANSNILVKIGVTPKIIVLEDNLDPDEFIIKNGQEAFTRKVDNPINIMDFKLNYLKNNKDLTDTNDLAKYVNEIILELNSIDDDVLKEVTIKKLSEESGLDVQFIKEKLETKEVKQQEVIIEKPKLDKCEIAESHLLFYMLHSKEVITIFENQTLFLLTQRYRLLANEIKYFYEKNDYINISELIGTLNENMINVVGEVLALNLKEEYTLDEINDYINVIRRVNIDNECNRLKKKMESEPDFVKRQEIGKQIMDLLDRGE